MRRLTRRDFLRLGAGAAVALGASPVLTGCVVRQAAAEPTARVVPIRGGDLYDMTRAALNALGGAPEIVNPGETVFIKPNMVTLPWANIYNPFVVGECTKPEIVIAVAEECLGAGAAEVIIGDGSQSPTFDWHYATTMDEPPKNLVDEAQRLSSEYDGNVTLACLDSDSPQWIEVPSRTGFGRIAVSSLVARADRVISLPVLKTHEWAQLTLSLKNFVGVTPLERYGWVPAGTYSRALLHVTPGGIEQVFLDIVDALKPDITIIDASIGVEGNGPTAGGGGFTVDMRDRLGSWLLLASTDLVAADATAARIISHDVGSVKHLVMAYELGLGEVREGSIEIVGDTLDNLRVDWLRAEPAAVGELAYHQAGNGGHVARHA